YVIDWDLTWFALNFKPSHDASFTPEHASRHLTFKFKLFLDDLPTLKKLKRTRPDLYMDELTCRSCIDRMEDLMHLFMCKRRRLPMQLILQSYQNHMISKILDAGKLADIDPTPFIAKLTSLSCWSFSSTNWSSYALVRDCLPKLFIDLFVNLSIPRTSAIKVITAIHNNFVQKFRRRIWNLRSYEKYKGYYATFAWFLTSGITDQELALLEVLLIVKDNYTEITAYKDINFDYIHQVRGGYVYTEKLKNIVSVKAKYGRSLEIARKAKIKLLQ
ncbi:hypothetical protein RhiirA5_441314, partial [Rhizophagus irregularis]